MQLLEAQARLHTYGSEVSAGTAPVSPVTAFGYAGQFTDATGLVYMQARYYDPAVGQFLSVDPLLDLTRRASGYTGGNPLQFADPSGLDWYNPTTWAAQTWGNASTALMVMSFIPPSAEPLFGISGS